VTLRSPAAGKLLLVMVGLPVTEVEVCEVRSPTVLHGSTPHLDLTNFNALEGYGSALGGGPHRHGSRPWR
jgi:hypothetical protein